MWHINLIDRNWKCMKTMLWWPCSKWSSKCIPVVSIIKCKNMRLRSVSKLLYNIMLLRSCTFNFAWIIISIYVYQLPWYAVWIIDVIKISILAADTSANPIVDTPTYKNYLPNPSLKESNFQLQEIYRRFQMKFTGVKLQ